MVRGLLPLLRGAWGEEGRKRQKGYMSGKAFNRGLREEVVVQDVRPALRSSRKK